MSLEQQLKKIKGGVMKGILFPVALASSPLHAGTVTLAWDPSSNAGGYEVFYGSASGNYSSHFEVGNVTGATVPDLPAGQTYFFAVRAYEAQRTIVSSFSNEVSKFLPVLSGDSPVDVTPKGVSADNELILVTSDPIVIGGQIFVPTDSGYGNDIRFTSQTLEYLLYVQNQDGTPFPTLRATDLDGRTIREVTFPNFSITGSSFINALFSKFDDPSYFGDYLKVNFKDSGSGLDIAFPLHMIDPSISEDNKTLTLNVACSDDTTQFYMKLVDQFGTERAYKINGQAPTCKANGGVTWMFDLLTPSSTSGSSFDYGSATAHVGKTVAPSASGYVAIYAPVQGPFVTDPDFTLSPDLDIGAEYLEGTKTLKVTVPQLPLGEDYLTRIVSIESQVDKEYIPGEGVFIVSQFQNLESTPTFPTLEIYQGGIKRGTCTVPYGSISNKVSNRNYLRFTDEEACSLSNFNPTLPAMYKLLTPFFQNSRAETTGLFRVQVGNQYQIE